MDTTRKTSSSDHLGLVELGHGLGAFADGVLGKLTWKDKADRGLDIAGRKRGALGDLTELASFTGDLLEGIGHEVVDDRDSLLGDTHLRVDLLEDLEDVALVRFRSTALSLRLDDGRGLLAFDCHDDRLF